MPRPVAVVTVVTLGALGAGCSKGPPLDRGRAEGLLSARLASKVEVVSVTEATTCAAGCDDGACAYLRRYAAAGLVSLGACTAVGETFSLQSTPTAVGGTFSLKPTLTAAGRALCEDPPACTLLHTLRAELKTLAWPERGTIDADVVELAFEATWVPTVVGRIWGLTGAPVDPMKAGFYRRDGAWFLTLLASSPTHGSHPAF